MRQIIHGGLGYDDPVEVTVADGSGVLNRLYPTFDEAGAGSLQSVLNASGEVVARPLIDGAYAEEETALGGVGIDRIAMAAKRDASGALESIELTIRATEPLDPKTVAAGSRLAAVAGNTVVRTTTAKPTLSDGATIRWTLTALEWSALTDSSAEIVGGKPVAPTSISIAVTDSLRGVAWSSATPVMPAPAWAVAARPVFASPALPVEYRESLTDAAALTSPSSSSSSSSAETPLYEIQSLTSLADPATTARAATAQRLLVTSTFHALPFAEPATRLIYARARWFDPASGTFLSPDPVGYRDSSNLSAYCGGDPVGRRDPTGLEDGAEENDWAEAWIREGKRWGEEEHARCEKNPSIPGCTPLFGDVSAKAFDVGSAYGRSSEILYINGILTSEIEAQSDGEIIARCLKAEVRVVWNPSHGVWKDLLQSAITNKLLSSIDGSTKKLLDELRRAILRTGGAGPVTLYAHSQGGLIAAVALGRLTPAQRARVDLVTFGAASWTYPAGLHSQLHIVNAFDWSVAMPLGQRRGPRGYSRWWVHCGSRDGTTKAGIR